jgi:hypothetical protein
MTIYILTQEIPYESNTILGVYSNIEDADAQKAEELTKKHFGDVDFNITPWEVE